MDKEYDGPVWKFALVLVMIGGIAYVMQGAGWDLMGWFGTMIGMTGQRVLEILVGIAIIGTGLTCWSK